MAYRTQAPLVGQGVPRVAGSVMELSKEDLDLIDRSPHPGESHLGTVALAKVDFAGPYPHGNHCDAIV